MNKVLVEEAEPVLKDLEGKVGWPLGKNRMKDAHDACQQAPELSC